MSISNTLSECLGHQQWFFNANILYDLFILNSSFDLPVKKVYRIESINGRGFYNDDNYEFCKGYVNHELHPSPKNESKFYNLFKNDDYCLKYRKEWIFGFESIKDAKSWINGTSTENCLGIEIYEYMKANMLLKEFIVPESFLICGNKQVIFKKNQIIYEKKLNFDLLDPRIDVWNIGNKML